MVHNAERALIKRINRRLAKDGEVLRTSRALYSDLGPWYIINQNNVVVAWRIDDLAALAAEIDCPLKDFQPA